MLFKEIILVYTEKYAQPINTNAALLIVKAPDTYYYLLALNS
jgi:hypothetical protein